MPEVRKIADRIRMVSVRTDKFKTSQIIVSMAVPMNENAAANALLVYLLKRSCKSYPDFTLLNRRLDELYGASLGAGILKTGDAQVLNISIDYIDDRFALDGESISDCCAELIAEMLFKPNIKNKSFGSSALEEERRLLVRRVESELDDKGRYAYEHLISNMCEKEPFGRSRYGTVEEIKAVRMADVYDAWKNTLETAVIQITAVGSGDPEKIASVFEKGFSGIERNPAEIETVFAKRGGRFKRIEESFPVNQGKLVIGFRAGTESVEDNRFAVTVMNDIFGGGTYSKLFTNVREKMSLAYYCSSSFIPSKGIIVIESGIDSSKEKTVTAEVVNQLNEIRDGKNVDSLLGDSKLSLRERFTFASPEKITAWYSSQVLLENILDPDEMINGIEAVTAEQVIEVAKKLSIDTIFMLSSEGGEADE